MTAGAPPPVPPRTSRTALDGIAASRVRTNRHATIGILHASGRTADLRERGRVQTKAKYREKYHQPEISHDLSFACQSESSEVPTSNQYATTPSSERSASLAKCVAFASSFWRIETETSSNAIAMKRRVQDLQPKLRFILEVMRPPL